MRTAPVAIRWGRFIPFWLVGLLPAFFVTSFLSNFYPSRFQFILLGLIFQTICGSFVYLAFDDAMFNWRENWTIVPVFCVAIAMGIGAVFVSWQFPGLFERRILFMDSTLFVLFMVLAMPSLAGSALIARSALRDALQKTRAWEFFRRNLAGIGLAMIFLFVYFIFAQSINFPGFRTLDQYFDTDISQWLERLTSSNPARVGVRAVHPAVLLFLHPLVGLISFFLNGDKLQALFLLHALTGAACVFLVWLIVKQISGDTTFSLIMASLLGAGTPHLLLGSMIETYIYSAFALLLFVYLMQSDKTDLHYTVPAGALVFGITVTNLVQTIILYVFTHPRLKVIVKYALAVVVVVFVLNLLQVQVYQKSMAMYDPANLVFEQKYKVEFLAKSWGAAGRFLLMVRAILLYAVVAPTPFILTDEIGARFPNFRVFEVTIGEFHVAGYTGLADLTVRFWMVILLAAGILFIRNLFRSPRQMMLPLALVMCMGFNLLLHTVWGDDPMLYSPDWAYALVLFVAYALRQWANHKWVHVALIVFLGMMMSVNLNLIHSIMQVSLPFYGQ